MVLLQSFQCVKIILSWLTAAENGTLMCEEVAARYKQIGVSILGPSGLKKMFLPHLLVKIQYCGKHS